MVSKKDINIDIQLSDINKLSLKCNKAEGCQYAFYVYRDDKCIEKISYSHDNELVYWLTLPGKYRISVFLKNESGEKVRVESKEVVFEQKMLTNNNQSKKETGVYYHSVFVLKEIVSNLVMAFRIAKYDYQLENKETYLGKLWSLLTPLIQIGTYWFVFGIGIRQGREVDGAPYVIWMLCGIIPWFFINGGILQGANSIMKKANTLTRMRFPLATVPVSAILVEAFEHIMMLGVMAVMFICMGYYPEWNWLNLVYYILFMVVFLVNLSLITSVLSVIARDFYKLLQSLMRLLFYVTPVLWTMDTMPQSFQNAMEFNPVYYIINGFRESILLGLPFYNKGRLVFFFWGMNLILFVFGANLQMKFRNKFIDLI